MLICSFNTYNNFIVTLLTSKHCRTSIRSWHWSVVRFDDLLKNCRHLFQVCECYASSRLTYWIMQTKNMHDIVSWHVGIKNTARIFKHNYTTIVWHVLNAQVGFDSGDGVAFYTHPYSKTAKVLNLATSSNVGLNGRWMFRVDGINIIPANTASLPGFLLLQYQFNCEMNFWKKLWMHSLCKCYLVKEAFKRRKDFPHNCRCQQTILIQWNNSDLQSNFHPYMRASARAVWRSHSSHQTLELHIC